MTSQFRKRNKINKETPLTVKEMQTKTTMQACPAWLSG